MATCLNSSLKFVFSTVEDADGDHVCCRWAESYLNECGGVEIFQQISMPEEMYVIAIYEAYDNMLTTRSV